VLRRQSLVEWGSPAFITPTLNKIVCIFTDFREEKRCIVCTLYPIPKVNTVLHNSEGFMFVTSLNINMGYYIIRLDADAQKYMYNNSLLGEIFIPLSAHER
jgi:hypothetical protein